MSTESSPSRYRRMVVSSGGYHLEQFARRANHRDFMLRDDSDLVRGSSNLKIHQVESDIDKYKSLQRNDIPEPRYS